MSPAELTDYVERAMQIIPNDGMGQQSLKQKLSISDEDFQDLKAELLQRNLVSVYRARGGGIRPYHEDETPEVNIQDVEKASDAEEQETAQILETSPDERALYPYIENWLLNSPKYGFTSARIIGDSHRRRSWDNPDLIAWNVYEYENFVGRDVEITAIEAKLSFTIYGIWQAANYQRFAHRVLLACYAKPEVIFTKEDGRLLETALNLGIGIVSLTPAGQGAMGMKCTEIVSPIPRKPMVTEIDSFITDFSDFFDLPLPGSILQSQVSRAMGIKGI